MIQVGYLMKYNQQNLVIYGEAHWTLIATKIVANMSELWNSIEWWSRRLLEDVRLVSETLMDELSETSLTSSKSLLDHHSIEFQSSDILAAILTKFGRKWSEIVEKTLGINFFGLGGYKKIWGPLTGPPWPLNPPKLIKKIQKSFLIFLIVLGGLGAEGGPGRGPKNFL